MPNGINLLLGAEHPLVIGYASDQGEKQLADLALGRLVPRWYLKTAFVFLSDCQLILKLVRDLHVAHTGLIHKRSDDDERIACANGVTGDCVATCLVPQGNGDVVLIDNLSGHVAGGGIRHNQSCC